jgi:hypothetical protein
MISFVQGLSSSQQQSLKDAAFIPVANSTRFLPPARLFARLREDVAPFAYELPIAFAPYHSLLRELGMRDAPTPSDLLSVLEVRISLDTLHVCSTLLAGQGLDLLGHTGSVDGVRLLSLVSLSSGSLKSQLLLEQSVKTCTCIWGLGWPNSSSVDSCSSFPCNGPSFFLVLARRVLLTFCWLYLYLPPCEGSDPFPLVVSNALLVVPGSIVLSVVKLNYFIGWE